MKFIFTAQFLKVRPPETSFADAWEALCADLLRYDLKDEECICLKAPDLGIDIILKKNKKAVQCKSDERGAFGTIQAAASIESLSTAMKHKIKFGWNSYAFATNANYSGNGIEQILVAADEFGLDRELISFHGPEHWSDLCEKHINKVRDRLDYRLMFSEDEVINAFKKARYFENKVREYEELIKQGAFNIEVSNNRTPIMLHIPFSPDLTIKNCLDVSMKLLNLDLDSEMYIDLGTSAKLNVSITIDQVPQGFNKKLGEYAKEDLSKLQLWIKIVWKEVQQQQGSQDLFMDKLQYRTIDTSSRNTSRTTDRRDHTLSRFESSIQNKMWTAVLS